MSNKRLFLPLLPTPCCGMSAIRSPRSVSESSVCTTNNGVDCPLDRYRGYVERPGQLYDGWRRATTRANSPRNPQSCQGGAAILFHLRRYGERRGATLHRVTSTAIDATASGRFTATRRAAEVAAAVTAERDPNWLTPERRPWTQRRQRVAASGSSGGAAAWAAVCLRSVITSASSAS
jgi:hypothetical protein